VVRWVWQRWYCGEVGVIKAVFVYVLVSSRRFVSCHPPWPRLQVLVTALDPVLYLTISLEARPEMHESMQCQSESKAPYSTHHTVLTIQYSPYSTHHA
jgi:hypothetical protein